MPAHRQYVKPQTVLLDKRICFTASRSDCNSSRAVDKTASSQVGAGKSKTMNPRAAAAANTRSTNHHRNHCHHRGHHRSRYRHHHPHSDSTKIAADRLVLETFIWLCMCACGGRWKRSSHSLRAGQELGVAGELLSLWEGLALEGATGCPARGVESRYWRLVCTAKRMSCLTTIHESRKLCFLAVKVHYDVLSGSFHHMGRLKASRQLTLHGASNGRGS